MNGNGTTLKRDEYGHPKDIGEVRVEEVEERCGWALFILCEGDIVYFHSFWKRKADALRYIDICNADHDSDDYMTDHGLAPAAIIDGRIVAANHYDDELGANVVLRAAGINGEDAERLREEATPKAADARPAQAIPECSKKEESK